MSTSNLDDRGYASQFDNVISTLYGCTKGVWCRLHDHTKVKQQM